MPGLASVSLLCLMVVFYTCISSGHGDGSVESDVDVARPLPIKHGCFT